MTHCSILKAPINSLFVSVQGEGPLIGLRQAFIRFAGCNLSCSYCDTDFSKKISCDYRYVLDFIRQAMPVHSVSLTGGEPLLYASFLSQLLPRLKEELDLPVYLETAGILSSEFSLIKGFVDWVAMDLKLPSVCGIGPLWDSHKAFLDSMDEKNIVIIKMVVSSQVLDEDMEMAEQVLASSNVDFSSVVLQPVHSEYNNNDLIELLMNWQKRLIRILGTDVRIIPQVHKFMGVE